MTFGLFLMIAAFWLIVGEGKLNFRLFGKEIIHLDLLNSGMTTPQLTAGEHEENDDEEEEVDLTVAERVEEMDLLTEASSPRLTDIGRLKLDGEAVTETCGCEGDVVHVSECVGAAPSEAGRVGAAYFVPFAQICDDCGRILMTYGGTARRGRLGPLVEVGANFHDVLDVIEGRTEESLPEDVDLASAELEAETRLNTIRLRKLQRMHARGQGDPLRGTPDEKTPPTS